MKTKFIKLFALSCFFVFSFSFSSDILSQEAPDYGKILGEWEIEIDAEGEYYYLTMKIEKSDGEPKGTVSEQTGFFEDVPISEIEYDGKKFYFKFTAATPPDGAERVIAAEFEVGDGKLEGYISIDDLGMIAEATATRKDK